MRGVEGHLIFGPRWVPVGQIEKCKSTRLCDRVPLVSPVASLLFIADTNEQLRTKVLSLTESDDNKKEMVINIALGYINAAIVLTANAALLDG